jgi:hypothetical protein
MVRAFAPLILAVVVFTSGCKKSNAPAMLQIPPHDPTKPALLDACQLLTFSEAEQAAETQLRGMRTALDLPSGDDFAKCSYGRPDDLGKTVSLELRRFESPEQAHEVQKGSEYRLRSLASGELVSVSEVGDEAFWGDGRLDQLHVRRGDLRAIITVSMGPDEGRKAAAIVIAQDAFRKLDARTAAAP